MNELIIPAFLLYLLVISIVDFRHKSIPSIFLTGFIIVLAFVNFPNLQYGVLALLLGLFLYEAYFFSGIADLKVITMLGLMSESLLQVLFIFCLVLLVGNIYKLYFFQSVKKKKTVPFVPVFFVAYVLFLIIKIFWVI